VHQRPDSGLSPDRRIGTPAGPHGRGAVGAVLSSVLLLLLVVSGANGFAARGGSVHSSSAVPTAAAAGSVSTPGTPDRRQSPEAGGAARYQYEAGWAPLHPEPADVVVNAWRSPPGLVEPATGTGPAVVALTVRVSHRGRAPPAGSLLM
jgi:hypothetical protein